MQVVDAADSEQRHKVAEMNKLQQIYGMAVLVWPLTLLVIIAISFVVAIVLARMIARRRGKSPRAWGWSAALIVYLIFFWDWLPTVALHQYYCATEAGFWVYKTPEQWRLENPGVMEGLVANKDAPSKFEQFDSGHGQMNTYFLNERFNWIVSQRDHSFLLPIIRTEQKVTDIKGNEVLARYVGFSTGNSVKSTIGPPGPMKFWMTSRHCPNGEYDEGSMYAFEHVVKGAEK